MFGMRNDMEQAPKEVKGLLQSFLDYHSVKGASPYTLRNYKREIGEFLAFAQEYIVMAGGMNLGSSSVMPEQINRNVVSKYLAVLTEQRLSPFSIQRKMYELRSFFRWLQREGLAELRPEAIPVPAAPQKLPRFLTQEEMNGLLCISKPLRDQAILETFYGTGIRLGELVGLNIDDLFLNARLLRVTGKGSKERYVCMGKPALEILKLYLAHRNGDGKESAFFLNEAGTRLSRRSVNHLVRKYGERAGLQRAITPHLIRHTFATHMLDGGANLRVIQELLGHKDLRTTQIYAHATPEGIRAAYNNCHPLGGRK